MVNNGNFVHVIGTGTIGEPLIGLLTDFRKELYIDEVTFSKNTPSITDRTKVWDLVNKGAVLCAEKGENGEKWKKFEELDMYPKYDFEEAIARATVVVDCTPEGNGKKHKEKFYEKHADGVKGFLAQGSEKGFGIPYAYSINGSAIDFDKHKFVQVVSCNTHNILAVIKTLAMEPGEFYLTSGRFNCIRRGTDISEEKGIVPSFQVDEHDSPEDSEYGTHQAEDAAHVLKTIGYEELDLFSSAMKGNNQYMHAIWFDIDMKKESTLEDVFSKIDQNPLVAKTYKDMTSLVCSFSRDHGYYGRLFYQTVFVRPTLCIRRKREILGWSFTPQDANSLLTSVDGVERYIRGNDWEQYNDKGLRDIFSEHFFKNDEV